jgi:TRAP-type C4-dicarboxylate transport system permease small subunit
MTEPQSARGAPVLLARWAAHLGRAQLLLAGLALVAMMLATVADVTMRYLFNNPVRGTYDFTEAMLVVFVFHGMASCFVGRTNIVIDLIDSFLRPRARALLERLGDFFSFVSLLLLAFAAWMPATQAFGHGERKLQLALPIWVLWTVALAGMVGTIVCAFVMLIAPRSSSKDAGVAA